MIFRELSNAAFRFSLRRPGAEILGGGCSNAPPPAGGGKSRGPAGRGLAGRDLLSAPNFHLLSTSSLCRLKSFWPGGPPKFQPGQKNMFAPCSTPVGAAARVAPPPPPPWRRPLPTLDAGKTTHGRGGPPDCPGQARGPGRQNDVPGKVAAGKRPTTTHRRTEHHPPSVAHHRLAPTRTAGASRFWHRRCPSRGAPVGGAPSWTSRDRVTVQLEAGPGPGRKARRPESPRGRRDSLGHPTRGCYVDVERRI